MQHCFLASFFYILNLFNVFVLFAVRCSLFAIRYSTYKTNPFKYSPSGW